MRYDEEVAHTNRMSATSSDAFAELNAEQLAAGGAWRRAAAGRRGRGTGKTRVITRRICHLLETNPDLSGENILGLTFTDKAAEEMKSRVLKAAGERADGVWLSTFHKFCLEKVLREGIPTLKVIEPVEHWILLRRNIRELALKHFTRLASPGEFLNDFEQFFSRCQDELVTPKITSGTSTDCARRTTREELAR